MGNKIKLVSYQALDVTDTQFRLLGAVDDAGNKWIARASVQALLGGVDFSKRFLTSSPDLHGETIVKKGESLGLLKDGRLCVFITPGLAITVISDVRYLKGNNELRQTALDVIELFVAGGSANKAAAAPEQVKAFAKPPESPADISPEILKAVEDAGLISEECAAEYSNCVLSDGSSLTGTCTILFMGQPISIYVTEKAVAESTVRKAYVKFARVCEHLALDVDKSMMVLSTVMNTSKWGLDMVVLEIPLENAAGRVTRLTLIGLDCVYSWLTTYDRFMGKMDPGWKCTDKLKGLIGIYQSALKEAALRFIGPLMKSVIPKAIDNAAGVKTRYPVDSGHPGVPNAGDARNEPGAPAEEVKADAEPPKFDKQAFLDAIKASKVPSAPKANEADKVVLDPQHVTMEAVAAVATKAYKKQLEDACTEIRTIEAEAGIGQLSSLARLEKPELPPKEEPKDPNWTWGDGTEFKEAFENGSADPVEDDSAVMIPNATSMDFYADNIRWVELNGAQYVIIRDVCRGLGIDPANQQEKLRADRRFSCSDITSTAADGKTYTMLALRLEHLAGWLFTINMNKVNPSVRPKLEFYQKDLVIAIDNYVRKGVAVNPAFSAEAITKACMESLAT